ITHDWGAYTRNSGNMRGGSNLIEVLVGADGRVISRSSTPGSGQLPAGAFAMISRGITMRTTLDALQGGEGVDITYSASSDITQRLQWSIGGATALVRDGVEQTPVHYDSPADEVDVQGRPAVGFKDGGRTMMLVVADGRQTDVRGLTADGMADLMKNL